MDSSSPVAYSITCVHSTSTGGTLAKLLAYWVQWTTKYSTITLRRITNLPAPRSSSSTAGRFRVAKLMCELQTTPTTSCRFRTNSVSFVIHSSGRSIRTLPRASRLWTLHLSTKCVLIWDTTWIASQTIHQTKVPVHLRLLIWKRVIWKTCRFEFLIRVFSKYWVSRFKRCTTILFLLF